MPGSAADAPIFLAARLQKLIDGSQMLRLEMPVNSVNGHQVDISKVQTWAGQQSQKWIYAHLRVETSKMNDTRYFNFSVEYSLPISGVTQEAIGDVVKVLRTAHASTWRTIELEIHSRRRRHLETSNRILSSRRLFDELDRLVGLAPVKEHVRKLAALNSVAALRAAKGLSVVPMSPHLVFTGNPGTGKTTVARLIGKLYKSLGLIKNGHVIEADRGDIVAGYLGQTALKMRAICEQAIDGVLFIDEAYSLDVDGRDFGCEAIETLLTFMEANRGKIVVIVAGYPAEMSSFIKSNPGLTSRFDSTLHFPDFNDAELLQVFQNLTNQHDYRLGVGVEDALRSIIANMPRGYGFGNAREMRRLFDDVVCGHAMSLQTVDQPTARQLALITKNIIEVTRPPQKTDYQSSDACSGYL